MSNKCDGKVLFITGAGRGMGTDIVKQALTAGYRVVATGRNPENAIFKQKRCHIAFGRSWTGEWRPYGSTKQAEQFRYLRPELGWGTSQEPLTPFAPSTRR